MGNVVSFSEMVGIAAGNVADRELCVDVFIMCKLSSVLAAENLSRLEEKLGSAMLFEAIKFEFDAID